MPANWLTFALFAMLLAPSDVFEGLRDTWALDLHQKKVEATLALYAPDAVFVQPDGSRVEGTAAIRTLFQTITATFDSDLRFASERVKVSGDLAFDSGSYTETLVMRSTGKKMQSRGSYLTVYRKQDSGEWKILEQVWTGAIQDSPSNSAVP